MDTEFFTQRIQCSRTDKQDCLLVVRQLMELATIAHNKGLLELDKRVSQDPVKYSDPFLRLAVSMIVDVGNTDLVRDTLYNFILSSNYSGRIFLQCVIITETMLAIQRNEDVNRIFRFIVPSYFGMDFAPQVHMAYHEFKQASRKEEELPEERTVKK